MNNPQKFDEDGFIFLTSAIESALLDRLEHVILSRARHDLATLGIGTEGLSPFELLRAVENNSQQRFYKLCSIGSSLAGLSVAGSTRVTGAVAELFGTDPSELFHFPPAIFFNDKQVTRLQYKWHQEATYLGAYERMITLWFPLFRDLSAADGPMIVARGSHNEVFPYTFSKEPNGVTQFSVAEEIASRFEQVPCAIARGDAVLFHRNLLHKTGENSSGIPRVSVVIRYFDVLRAPEFEPLMVANNITRKDWTRTDTVAKP